MKANIRLRGAFTLAAAVGTVLVASCSAPPGVVPTPAPAPSPLPRPSPPPAPRPSVDWRQAPLTPGDWRWSMEGGQSVARFANGLLVLRCDPARRTITMLRAGSAEGQVPLTVTTSATSRPLMGMAQDGPPPVIAVTLQARDPLLDAMAFSRGRFAVDTAGMPSLYVPSWTEVSRVIEDCR